MAAVSKHWGDVNVWIIRVINSCKTILQVYSTFKLIDKYDEQYSNIPDGVVLNLHNLAYDKIADIGVKI